MPTRLRWMAALLLLVASAPAAAKGRACSGSGAAAAEEAVGRAHESWAALHAQYRKYAAAMDCDDGAVAEGWDDAVARLLSGAWGDLPALGRLVRSDPDFLPFVVRHVTATAATGDLEGARANAGSRCPWDEARELCRLIADAASAALTEGGCSYSSPPGDASEARRRAAALAPQVRWSTTLRVDLVGKGKPDYVLLGEREAKAVVGVVLGAACDRGFVFEFEKDARSQDGLCGDPATARVSAARLASRDDPDAPLGARGAPGTRRRGFRLESGECDAFHFYFDGLAVRWWRR